LRIIYVITSLGVGAAEKQICSVCDNLLKFYDHNIHIEVLNNNLKSKLKNKIEKFINLKKNFLDKKANYAYKEIKRNFSIEKTFESWHNNNLDICK